MHPLLVIPLIWLFLSLLLAYKGKDKKIGFSKALVLSLILTPIVGIIFVMKSPKKYPRRVRPKGKEIEL